MNFLRNQVLTKHSDIKYTQSQTKLKLLYNICNEFNLTLNEFVDEYKNYVDINIKETLYDYQSNITTLINTIDTTTLSISNFKEILNKLVSLEFFLKQNTLDYKCYVSTLQSKLQNIESHLKDLKYEYDNAKNNLDSLLIKEKSINKKECDRIIKKHNEYMSENKTTLNKYQRDHIIYSNKKVELEKQLETVNYQNSNYKEIAKLHRSNILEQVSVNKKIKTQQLLYKESAHKKLETINSSIDELELLLQNYKEYRYNVSIDYHLNVFEIANILQYILSILKIDSVDDADNNIRTLVNLFNNTEYKVIMNNILCNLELPILELNLNQIENIKNNLDSFICSVNNKINNNKLESIKQNINILKELYGYNISQYLEYINAKLKTYSNNYLEKELDKLSKTRKSQELKLYKLKQQQRKLNNIINRKVNTAIPIKDNFLIDKRNELTEINKKRKLLTIELSSVNKYILELDKKIETLSILISDNKYTPILLNDLNRCNDRITKILKRTNTKLLDLKEKYNNNINDITKQKIELNQKLINLQNLEKGYNKDFISRLNIVISNIQKYC
jgi:hypothetical protein